MIEILESPKDDILEVRLSGKVTGEDYDETLTPAIEAASAKHDKIRMLAQIGPGFEGYTLQAAWDDTRLGLTHWNGFERVAVATDVDWIATAVRAVSFAMPCPVKAFDLTDLDSARQWVSEEG